MSADQFWLGEIQVDPRLNLIHREDLETTINPRSMAVLQALAAQPGEVVAAADLLNAAWPSNHADPNAIYKAIRELREAMNDSPNGSRVIETLSRRGYRLLIAPSEHPPVADADHEPAGAHSGPVRYRLLLASLPILLLAGALGVAWSETDLLVVLQNKSFRVEMVGDDSMLRSVQLEVGERLVHQHSAELIEPRPWTHENHVVQLERVDDTIIATILPGLADVSHVDRVTLAGTKGETKAGREMAELIVDHVVLLADPDRLRWMQQAGGTSDLDAWMLYQQAHLIAYGGGPRRLKMAIPIVEAALEQDPSFAGGYVSLAGKYRSLARAWPDESQTYRDRIKELTARARWNGLSQETIGVIELLHEMTFLTDPMQLAEDAVKQIKGGSYDPTVLTTFEKLLVGAGFLTEGRAYLDLYYAQQRGSEATSPLYPNRRNWDELTILGAEGNRRDQLQLSLERLEQIPSAHPTLVGVVSIYASLGNSERVDHFIARLADFDPTGQWQASARVRAAAIMERRAPGSAELASALGDPNLSSLDKGFAFFVLGDVERGVRAWRKIDPSHLQFMWQFLAGSETWFAPNVVTDPRYQNVLDELGLGGAVAGLPGRQNHRARKCYGHRTADRGETAAAHAGCRRDNINCPTT